MVAVVVVGVGGQSPATGIIFFFLGKIYMFVYVTVTGRVIEF